MTVVADVSTEPRGARSARAASAASPARDKLVLAVMCGIPSLLLIAFVWFPALASVGLSFTSWDGIGGIGTIKWVGVPELRPDLHDLPAVLARARHNIIWLAFLACVPTTFGIFLAVLLDKQIRFSRIYQSALYLPVMLSLVLVGFIAQLFYSPDQGFINGALGQAGHRPGLARRPEAQPLGGPDRRGVAAHRLHHGPLPGRPEERRPVAARRGQGRRRERVADVPAA